MVVGLTRGGRLDGVVAIAFGDIAAAFQAPESEQGSARCQQQGSEQKPSNHATMPCAIAEMIAGR